MVCPGRELLAGTVEVDETYLGSEETDVWEHETEKKTLIAVAVEENGKGIGRIRMRQIPNASASSLEGFITEAVSLGSEIHTDGWEGYAGLERRGYQHQVMVLSQSSQSPSGLLPRVHRVVALLKNWLRETHQGAVSPEHLDYYLDEFTFRFNGRTSQYRGKLFVRLLENAMKIEPVSYQHMIKHVRGHQPENLKG